MGYLHATWFLYIIENFFIQKKKTTSSRRLIVNFKSSKQ